MPCPAALREAVRTIVQIKRGKKGEGVAAQLLRDSIPATTTMTEGVEEGRKLCHNVVFACQHDLGLPAREFRVPVLVEGTSVVVPVRLAYRVRDGGDDDDDDGDEIVELVGNEDESVLCDAVRVGRIKVEGNASEEASRALKGFWERDVMVEDVAGMDYAVDVIAKRVG